MPRLDIMKEHGDTQGQILDAAMRHFAEHGYRGASLAQIAKEAGVSKSLIFWYFENKAKLFEALMDRFISQCMRSLDVQGPSGNPRNKIGDLMDTYWEFIRCNFKFVRIFMNWFMQLERNKKGKTQKLRELHAKFQNTLAEYLREGVTLHIFRNDLDIQATAFWLMSSLEGVLLQMFINDLQFDQLATPFFGAMKQNLLDGLGSNVPTMQ